MSQKLSDKNVFVVRHIMHQITGAKLPSGGQVLSVLFYNICKVNLTISESANLVIRECLIFWEKARISTKNVPNRIKKKKLTYVYRKESTLKKFFKNRDIFQEQEKDFELKILNLFDIEHAVAMEIIKIEENKQFLLTKEIRSYWVVI